MAVASEGQGIAEIAAMIAKHRAHMEEHGEFTRRRALKMKTRIEEIVRDQLHVHFWNGDRAGLLEKELTAVMAFEETPYQVADALLKNFKNS
jgi:LAO/AO transport system kinase